MSSTRDRILDAARTQLEREGVAPSMSAVARGSGISRQALYLHFPDRAQLLVALVAHVDDHEELAAGIAAIESAPGGAAKVRAAAQMQAWRNPRIAPLARALDHERRADSAADAAWQDRMANRRRGAEAIVAKLRAEGAVHRSWTAAAATALLWELVSFRVWDDLVGDAGIAPGLYVEIVTTTALAALAAPVGRARGVAPPRAAARARRVR